MHPTRRRLIGVLILVLAVLAVIPGVAAAGTPARKLTLGINMVPDRDLSVLDDFSASIGGQKPGIWAIWGNWGDPSGVFPSAVVAGLKERGVTPMLVWQPQNGADVNSPKYTFKRIAAGKHDAYIKTFARAARDAGVPIILRFAHEMDGHWFPWGMGRFDNTPKTFKAAWRHVWNIFKGPKGVGATNVKFLWSPASPGGKRPTYAAMYPGDKYVDYVGFTAFNWVRRGIPWKSMVQLYSSPMGTLGRITRKPVIVGETGTGTKGGNKPAWIRKGYPAVYKKWARLKAIVYFNVDMTEAQNRNWLLTNPLQALDAFETIAAQARFQGRIR